MEDKVYIIVLNWNGWKDSIECIESIYQSEQSDFRIVLIDNGSTDDSILNFHKWINSKEKGNIFFSVIYSKEEAEKGGELEQENSLKKYSGRDKLVLIKADQNYGFAKGNNIGISYTLHHYPKYLFLLNNDTVIEKNCLSELYSFFEKSPEIQVATPQIRYFDTPDKIWNCGGKLVFNCFRKYFFANQNISKIPKKIFIPISFVTGCALFIRTDLVIQIGGFSEKFFFGEEDFEFSLRLKKFKKKAVCVLTSVLYHKINSSFNKTTTKNINKTYIYYLNRFINVKQHSILIFWIVWVIIYSPYIFILLVHKYTFSETTLLFKKLYKNSFMLNKVSKEHFDDALKDLKLV